MLAFPRLVLKSRPVSIFRNSGEIFDSAQGRHRPPRWWERVPQRLKPAVVGV
jgi:hypothetical protein